MRAPSDMQYIMTQVSDVNMSPASHEGPEFSVDIWLVIAQNLALNDIEYVCSVSYLQT
jgi:hypothetical protein